MTRSRLYFECGRGGGDFRCTLCNYKNNFSREHMKVVNPYDDIKQHLFKEHEQDCYRCPKCGNLHVNQKELKKCCKI
jgi:hypothetical protein